jgi:hypothetical protein
MQTMDSSMVRALSRLALAGLVVALAACAPGGGGGGGGGNPQGTNRARFTYQVDLQGEVATMVLEAEVVGVTGLTWGPGVTPDITGVISTGQYTVYTSGQLASSTANYIFTGENQFADFTETSTFERFRVQWFQNPQGLMMVVNPFGPGPVTYQCNLVGVQAL